jgi:hypothetical protein
MLRLPRAVIPSVARKAERGRKVSDVEHFSKNQQDLLTEFVDDVLQDILPGLLDVTDEIGRHNLPEETMAELVRNVRRLKKAAVYVAENFDTIDEQMVPYEG